jgi:FtsZ-binding cell division protein ZapB
MEDFKYYNLREFTLDLTELLNEVEDLREENASLKKQVADYNDFITNLNKRNQEFAVETIKQLINDIR